MTRAIRAHFDGTHLVPDEPVDLPVNQPLRLLVSDVSDAGNRPEDIESRSRRLQAVTGLVSAPAPTAESLRRENLYDNDS